MRPDEILRARLAQHREGGGEDAASLTRALLEARRHVEALEVATEGLAAAPSDVERMVLLGRARLATGDLFGAEAMLLRAARTAPHRADALRFLGEALLSRGDAARAAKVLERAVSLEPADPTLASLLEDARLGRVRRARGPEPERTAPEAANEAVESASSVSADAGAAREDERAREEPPPPDPTPRPEPAPVRPAAPEQDPPRGEPSSAELHPPPRPLPQRTLTFFGGKAGASLRPPALLPAPPTPRPSAPSGPRTEESTLHRAPAPVVVAPVLSARPAAPEPSPPPAGVDEEYLELEVVSEASTLEPPAALPDRREGAPRTPPRVTPPKPPPPPPGRVLPRTPHALSLPDRLAPASVEAAPSSPAPLEVAPLAEVETSIQVETPVALESPLEVLPPIEVLAPVEVEARVKVPSPIEVLPPIEVLAPVEVEVPPPIEVPSPIEVEPPVEVPSPIEVLPPIEVPPPVEVPPPIEVLAPVEVPPRVEVEAPIEVPPRVEVEAPIEVPPPIEVPSPIEVLPPVEVEAPVVVPAPIEVQAPVVVPAPIEVEARAAMEGDSISIEPTPEDLRSPSIAVLGAPARLVLEDERARPTHHTSRLVGMMALATLLGGVIAAGAHHWRKQESDVEPLARSDAAFSREPGSGRDLVSIAPEPEPAPEPELAPAPEPEPAPELEPPSAHEVEPTPLHVDPPAPRLAVPPRLADRGPRPERASLDRGPRPERAPLDRAARPRPRASEAPLVETDEARLRTLMAENPHDEHARTALAALLLTRDEQAAAEQVLAAEGDETARRLAHLRVLVRLGRASEARAALDALPVAARSSAAARMSAARLALATGQPEDAVHELAPIAQGPSAPAPVLALYGQALLALGRVADASSAYAASAERDASLPETLLGRAEMAVRSRRAADALRILDRLDDVLQNTTRPAGLLARARFLRGRAQLMSEQRAAARRTLLDVLTSPGAPPETHFFLGEAHNGHDFRAARDAYLRYLEVEPDGYYARRARRALGREE